MAQIKTTLRIEKELKLQTEEYALRHNLTFQEITGVALKSFLHKPRNSKQLSIKTVPLGGAFDKTTRKDFYS